jgi:putative transcriptional regulator
MSPHVTSELYEYALQILDSERSAEIAMHLRECRSCLLALGAINDEFAEVVVPTSNLAPKPSLRSRLLKDVSEIVPYARYLDDMAKMLVGSPGLLEDELRGLPHPNTWDDGPVDHCRLFPCEAGTTLSNVIRTLVLMESGSTFPDHEHLGDEHILVLQGSLLDEDGQLYRPGDKLYMAEGTHHSFEVPVGLDLIYFNVSHQGLQIGEQIITPASLNQ